MIVLIGTCSRFGARKTVRQLDFQEVTKHWFYIIRAYKNVEFAIPI